MVVVTWQGRRLLQACLRSLQAQTVPHTVLVVDNASDDGTIEMLAVEFPHTRVVHNSENLGFAGGVVAALPHVDTPYLALLNNDAVAEPDWLAQLLRAAEEKPGAGAITSLLLLTGSARPTVNNAGVVLLDDGYGADRGLGQDPADYVRPEEVFGFSGGAALLRTDAVRAVGGFPGPFFLYYEDTDTSWRMRKQRWSIWFEPRAVVHHQHSATADQTSAAFAFYNERNRLLMHVRCASLSAVVRVWARFVLTTGSLASRRLLGGPAAGAHQQRVRLRLKVLAGAVRLVPWAIASRVPRAAREGDWPVP